MSDNKFCPSCGTSLSLTAKFCHKCGQKQVVDQPIQQEQKPEPVNSEQSIPEVEISTSGDQPEVSEIVEEAVDSTSELDNEEIPVEPVDEGETPSEAPTPLADQVTEPESPKTNVDSTNETPVQETPKQSVTQPLPQEPTQQYTVAPPVTPVPQQNMNQPNYYQQPPVPQQPTVTKAKKKFPWFFTVLWVIMFVAVGVWAYFLMVDPNYDYPMFTEDAKRIVLFTVAVALLVYTLSLKLAMRKFKVFPTIILIVAALVVFYFYCMVELTADDWLHQVFSDLTDSILPVIGR